MTRFLKQKQLKSSKFVKLFENVSIFDETIKTMQSFKQNLITK